MVYSLGLVRTVNVGLGGCTAASRGAIIGWDAPDQGRFFSWLVHLTS